MKIYFFDFFNLEASKLEEYGAFNISLINDLPLFIDPFLLFGSKRPEYQTLHKGILKYLTFLKSKSYCNSEDLFISSPDVHQFFDLFISCRFWLQK